ncbi:uncharacterized protein N7484_007581 [Penicillium longicatenatum]|uniref:uncharacterized protein n=1 Tax=Penicillium longicatenatum TaxID=1561947 RepID=UPI002548ADE7|nr:uncharacterized protein N7484_007581 [Penicillium longicatenatum]KAJ5639719.1 hypothetical protein N7484_007581 [Penicillium longicatenatum]
MTSFYEGSLQDGIALALRETKAVVCFVRDENQTSSTWEEEYFAGEEIAQILDAGAVLLRITAGSQEAGFLTSLCPIAKFPTVIVINNGTLKEYLVPDISKDIFQSRLGVAVKGQTPSEPVQQSQSSSPAVSPVPNITPAQYPTPQTVREASSSAQPKPRQDTSTAESATRNAQSKKPVPAKPQPPKVEQKKPVAQPKKEPLKPKQTIPSKKATPSSEERKPQPPVPRGPPTQYRLQVRLFDGSSVRSSFTPTQTIRSDVRPWLDGQMGTEQRPYNLKHILTPLPSRTLSVSEETQSLQDLGLGSTANLVMVPVASYTDAYSTAGSSLPVRGISAVYNAVSSVASTATGLVGSLIGYGPTAPAATGSGSSSASTSASSENTQRPRNTGLNIRTLGDQQNDRKDSQFYNGNQLNFEPRDQDRKDN